ncbi:hypothetical protein BDW74DRAFT_176616 [Aspergillus multicolor]|uniref:uncharacterized protein n=1 Tax=Aspergillus multicolor TaxID=41759 RepID=UPI003CCC9CA7
MPPTCGTTLETLCKMCSKHYSHLRGYHSAHPGFIQRVIPPSGVHTIYLSKAFPLEVGTTYGKSAFRNVDENIKAWFKEKHGIPEVCLLIRSRHRTGLRLGEKAKLFVNIMINAPRPLTRTEDDLRSVFTGEAAKFAGGWTLSSKNADLEEEEKIQKAYQNGEYDCRSAGRLKYLVDYPDGRIDPVDVAGLIV